MLAEHPLFEIIMLKCGMTSGNSPFSSNITYLSDTFKILFAA